MNIKTPINFNEEEGFIIHKIQSLISEHNYENVYLVGGCVRDKLLQMNTFDFDISCPPDIYNEFVMNLQNRFHLSSKIKNQKENLLRLEKILEPLIIQQEPSAGTKVDSFILVENSSQNGSNKKYKIDIRVLKDSSVKADALTRDFTINAIFYDLKNNTIIDCFDVFLQGF